MKIEMGESLFYSWLRHVKGCQVVQTNWKASPQWPLLHIDELQVIMDKTDRFFEGKYGYKIYKKSSSLAQVIHQGESDAIGISLSDGAQHLYAVDVAFHENGLQYGSRAETVMKITNKCIRTAMCLYGYFGARDADVIFASPKINPSTMNDAALCIQDTQELFREMGYGFTFRIIANGDFKEDVLLPLLSVSSDVADTNELFLRSYQLLHSANIHH